MKVPTPHDRWKLAKKLSVYSSEAIDDIASEAKKRALETAKRGSQRRSLKEMKAKSADATLVAYVDYLLWRDPELKGKVQRACEQISAKLRPHRDFCSIASADVRSVYYRAKGRVESNTEISALKRDILDFLKDNKDDESRMHIAPAFWFSNDMVLRPTRPRTGSKSWTVRVSSTK